MKCPECNEEMVEVLPAQVQLTPLQTVSEVYPSKIICSLYHIYSCDKCDIKASKPEHKDYLAVPDPIIDGKTCVSSNGCKKEHKLDLDGKTPICPCIDYLKKE